MQRAAWWTLVGGMVLACSAGLSQARGGKGTVVEFDGLKSTAPAEWKEEGAKGLRYMQFRLPKVKDDKNDAEIVIFRGIGGSTQANIDRWKGLFTPPAGKSIGDVSKVTEFKVSGVDVSYLDVHGTYLHKTRPNDPNDKGEKRPNSRMFGVVFEGKAVYHIRLVGPAATVEHYRKGFDEWLKAFK
jgi:hypothetical protein